MNRVFIVVIGLLFFVAGEIFPQSAVLRGQIVNRDNAPIPGVNVYLEGTVLGSATNSDGAFLIEKVPAGEFLLNISIVGYRQESISVIIQELKEYDLGKIVLSQTALLGQPVVVTASKYEQKRQDIPVSLSTLSRQELAYRNTVKLDEALQYISGVNMNSSQISIRGSSGYTLGVGSRVLFMIDGVPLLTGDTRDINYETVPLYLVDHVEVLKGAGSALYGSSALGGVINIITKNTETAPRYTAKIYSGIYSPPSYNEWRWSEQERYLNGQNFSYSNKFKNFGFILGASRDQDDSYRENGWRRRFSGGGKMQWDFSSFQQLTLAGNYMHQKRGNFLYWKDLNHALMAGPGQEDDEVESDRYYITAHYRHILNRKRFITFRSIWFWNRFKDTVSSGGGNRSTSRNLNAEIQYNSQYGRIFFTGGFEGTFNSVESDIFGNNSSYNGASYIQLEVPLHKNLHTTLGTRLDYFNMDSLDPAIQLNPKIGIVFKPYSATAIRTSAGLGFRGPSMGEVFVRTEAGGFPVRPNYNLKPEKSYYTEIGFNQLFGKWLMIDAAGFNNELKDLIEGVFLSSGEIQFRNITKARVFGFESNINTKLYRNLLNLNIGYTYLHPEDLTNDQILNFRPRHLFYSKFNFTLKPFTLGTDYRYISRYERIDRQFLNIINNADERVATHVVDIHLLLGFKLFNTPSKISFQLNNALNYYYTQVVGSLAQLRNFSVAIEMGL